MWRWLAPFSTTRAGPGMRPTRSARRSSVRRNTGGPAPINGPAPNSGALMASLQVDGRDRPPARLEGSRPQTTSWWRGRKPQFCPQPGMVVDQDQAALVQARDGFDDAESEADPGLLRAAPVKPSRHGGDRD